VSSAAAAPVTLSPALHPGDAVAAHWLRQVTVRLRREVTWLRHARGGAEGAFPGPGDRLQHALDLARFRDDKADFFAADPTAAWLTQLLREGEPRARSPERGTFGWAAEELELDAAGRFLLALGVAAAFDHAVGTAMGACLGLAGPAEPTLALAQHLWDEPEEVLGAADPGHPLFAHGLLQWGGQGRGAAAVEWDRPLRVPPLVARQLLFPGAPLPGVLAPLEEDDAGDEPAQAALVAARLAADAPGLRVVPVRGPRGSAHAAAAAAVARLAGRPAARFRGDPALLRDGAAVDALATLAWLRGVDLFVDAGYAALLADEHHGAVGPVPAPTIPAVLLLGVTERRQLPRLPDAHLLPIVEVPVLSHAERLAAWERALGPRARGVARALPEVARRFRFGRAAVQRVAAGLAQRRGRLTADDLVDACRAEVDLDVGELAERVVPRFAGERVLLPPPQARQFDELLGAMRTLTDVHYRWGTAKAWSEGGITALFAGPPGTGKTMAAEVLAAELGLPMYRIDLSQVVNKYIGETEKNLKRLFDAADLSDLVLFFDEADSLFGKRTEVKDAHDRYANLEISYLLERMERFKGLAILATNRRKDLDEAFLRRLRFIIEFPLPDEERRRELWRQMVPEGVDADGIDFGFLARQFPLAGGHIRSAVFHACLQGARHARDGERRLRMEDVVAAVKREYDKLNRPVGFETFGPWARLVEEMTPPS
jgi:hypothetical protein